MKTWTLIACLFLMSAHVTSAQKPVERDRRTTEAEEKETLRERLRKAIRLPRTTQEARREGASEEDVQRVLKTGRERGIPAGDMQEILEEENEELREGRRDNFGAAVQEMKASGLRGRELADAIHAEQVARGMKKPKDKSKLKHEDKDRRKGGEYDDELAGKQADRDHDAKAKGNKPSKGPDKAKAKGKGKKKER